MLFRLPNLTRRSFSCNFSLVATSRTGSRVLPARNWRWKCIHVNSRNADLSVERQIVHVGQAPIGGRFRITDDHERPFGIRGESLQRKTWFSCNITLFKLRNYISATEMWLNTALPSRPPLALESKWPQSTFSSASRVFASCKFENGNS